MPDGWRGIVIVLVGFLIAVIAFRLVYNPKPPQELPVPEASSVASADPQPSAHAMPATAPTEPSVGPIVIAGHVVSEEHNALSGATLHLSNETTRQRLTSGIDGAFTFAEISSSDGYTLSVGADGFVGKRIELNTIPSDELTNLTIELERGIVVTGVAVYPDGGPVEGLNVGANEISQKRQSSRVITDEQGHFEVGGMYPGTWSFWSYRTIGSFTQSGPEVVLVDGSTPEPIRLIYSPPGAAKVEGIVVDFDGAPIADANVVAMATQPAAETKSKGDGTFSLFDLAEAAYTIYASKDSYQAVSVENVAAPAQGLSIVLPDSPTVDLHVLDAESRQPIPEFEYMVKHATKPTQEIMAYTRASSSDGRVSIALNWPDAFDIVVRATGHCQSSVESLQARDFVSNGEPVEIWMSRCAEIHGRVVDTTGKGVGDAVIARRAFGRTSMRNGDELARTASDGTFTIDSPAKGLYVLHANHPTLGHGSYVGERGQPLPEPIEIVLDSAASVVGVVTLNGIPCSKGEVVLRSDAGESKSAPIAPNGAFEFAQVAPGDYGITANGIHMESVFSERGEKPITVDGGARRHVTLAYRSGNLAIHGETIDGDVPIQNVRIAAYALGSETPFATTLSGRDGVFSLEQLESGTYRVEARLTRGIAQQLRFREITLTGVDVTGVVFSWEAGGRVVVDVSGRSNHNGVVALVDSSQALVGPASLEMANQLLARQLPGAFASRAMDPTSPTYAFDDVPAGEYQVFTIGFPNLDAPNEFRITEAFITVTAGEETTVALTP